jgi:hypothetical protein
VTSLMADKLKSAGVKLPSLRQRVWNYLNDHKRSNLRPRDICKALSADRIAVAKAIASLVSLRTLKKDSSTGHPCYYAQGADYLTPPSPSVLEMGKEKAYSEIDPISTVFITNGETIKRTYPSVIAFGPTPVTTKPESKAKAFVRDSVGDLTVNELREVHAELGRMLSVFN